MSEQGGQPVGSIGWVDLTVENADAVRDFYRDVTGWTASPVDMGGYSDYCMNEPASGRPVAAVCHARGENANLPAQWLMYITVVDDVEKSARRCVDRGGSVIAGPQGMGGKGRYCVIRDPTGAVAALFEPRK